MATKAAVKVPVAPKASAQAEVLVGQAAIKLSRAVEEIKSATTSVETLAERFEKLSLEVSNKEARNSDLDLEYAEKKRQLDVQFELDLKEDQLSAINVVLDAQDKIAVDKSVYKAVLDENTRLKTDQQKEIDKAVAQVGNKMKNEAANERALLEAAFQTKEANNVAQIQTLEKISEVYKEQIASLTKQINDERDASVKRAQAGAIGTINVGDSGSGKR